MPSLSVWVSDVLDLYDKIACSAALDQPAKYIVSKILSRNALPLLELL